MIDEIVQTILISVPEITPGIDFDLSLVLVYILTSQIEDSIENNDEPGILTLNENYSYLHKMIVLLIEVIVYERLGTNVWLISSMAMSN